MTFAANATFYLFVCIAIYITTGDSGQCTRVFMVMVLNLSLTPSLPHTHTQCLHHGYLATLCLCVHFKNIKSDI